ncbi:MAG: YdcF family protein [Acidimicrobiia bacterium]
MARFLRGPIVLRVALVLFLVGFVYFTVTFVQVWMAARRDDARPSQAIVVLGAAQFDGRPSAVFEARLDHAADLYAEGIAPTVVVTGGKQEGDRFTEAAAGAEYLHSRGVPDDAILRETTSRSSWESLSATANFLEEREITEVVLVSDPFHSLRIEAIADELGLDAVTSPTRTSPIRGFGEWRRFFTEAVRVSVGRVVGFGRLARHGDRVGRLVPGLGILAGPSGVV